MTIIKGGKKITVEAAQDDLNIILEDILRDGKPSTQSLNQLEYDVELLTEMLEKTDDQTDAHNIANIINLIERILKEYRQSTSPIRVSREDKDRLKAIGSTYPKALKIVLDFWDEHHA